MAPSPLRNRLEAEAKEKDTPSDNGEDREDQDHEDDENETPEAEREKEDEPPKDDANQLPPTWTMISAASYAVIMLLIGLPLWWKTTTVERVPLPYQEMLELHDQFQENNFIVPLNVLLKGFPTIDGPTKDRSWHYFQEGLTNSESKLFETSQSLEDVDSALCKNANVGNSTSHLIVYNIRQSQLFKLYGEKIVLGNCRFIYSVSNTEKVNLDKLNSVLGTLISYTKNEDVLPLAISYNILFTLIVPEPELFDAQWEIERSVKDYVHPILDKLKSLSSFITRGQTIFYHKLNLKPSLVDGVYQIPYEQLPLVINPVESKLTSFVSENPVLNFLIYVSPCDVSPLQILDENRSSLTTNSFYVPQWGGIQIYNSNCDKDKKSVVHQVQMPQVMSIIIAQFRDLIGVPTLADSTATVLDFRGSALRDWEIDFLIRKRLHKLLETSSNTLKSLGNLLEQITNIVVKEEVGQQVELSVNSLQTAHKEATAGNITTAQAFAQVAFTSSELAFHHPSNLAQLYFPDDQKYAIYIPLYLPVGIPVLLSLVVIVKRLAILSKLRKVKTE